MTEKQYTEYDTMFKNMVIVSRYLSAVKRIVNTIKKNRTRYELVSTAARCPWFVVGIIHYLEADFNFNTHLFNGDPLSARTVREPIGYPRIGNPPFQWEDSALLALKLKNIIDVSSTDIPVILYKLEQYNGMGYRYKRYFNPPINTPYLWSFTTYYSRGKFIDDHVASDTAVSNQSGAAPLLKLLLDAGNVVTEDVSDNFMPSKNNASIELPVDYAVYRNNTERTLQQFLDVYGVKMSPADVLSYKDNSKTIFKSYNSKQQVQYKTANVNLVGIGAKILIPFNKISSNSIYMINQTLVENKDYKVFIETEIQKLLNNPRYIRLNTDQTLINPASTVYKKQDRYSVWIWCKSFSPDGSQLFDLSPFIETVSINTTQNGSNWTISLPHITYKRNVDGEFILNLQRYDVDGLDNNFVSKNNMHHKQNFELLSTYQNNRFVDDNDELQRYIVEGFHRRYDSAFVDMIQSNDVIFIRLEPLGVEDRISELSMIDDNFLLSADMLPDKVFDLIGLVDDCSISTTAENNDQSVILNGRCLSKLLIDDGVYFFPVEYAVINREQIIKNSSKTRSGNRLFLPQDPNVQGMQKNIRFRGNDSGAMIGDTQFNFDKVQTISEWVVFILSQLTNIAVAPDELFKQYKNKTLITSRNGDINTDSATHYETGVPATGIWQIIKLALDNEIVDRKTVDSSLATDTGSLLNLIQKVCQKPFVEFSMDTYGDKFYFIIKKPPFTYESFSSNFCINIFDQDVETDTLTYAVDEIYSWYKLNPFVNVFGFDENSGFMSIFPGVMFPEYVDQWGSKALEISSNFLDFDISDSSDTKNNFENIKKQGFEDLDWVIETHACLPFTRKGTITIKPDRRIKRGINIRFFPTGEIFYVEAVSQVRNNGGISNGHTTITVSHGMKEKYLQKYFQIINLMKDKDIHKQEVWTVNQEIFKFFINRTQNEL